jgi:BirA family biotin operon repressor/biotin-[acetyl-CoA-carboxylase] ligase
MLAADLERVREMCRRRGICAGAAFEYRASTGSTNDDVLALARSGAPHGSVLCARAQRAGRGRHGAEWFSPPGDNLTFSVLLRPEVEPAECTLLPLLAGLAVRQAVARRVEANVGIKWPNDVWIDGRKVAGILVESVMRGQVLQAVVVGIGINVRTSHFPEELALTATSLALAGARDLDAAKLLVVVLESLEQRVARLVGRDVERQLSELNRYDALVARHVEVDGVVGTAAGIGEGGVLLIETERGVERCIAGTVTLLD